MQNPNESFNYVIWSHEPKTVFLDIDTLKLGVWDAVITIRMHSGHLGKVKVLQKYLGDVGPNCVADLKMLK